MGVSARTGVRMPVVSESSAARRVFLRWVSAVVCIAVAVATFGIVSAPSSASAAAGVPKRMMSGWLPYWSSGQSLNSVVANAELFSDVSPFWHNASSSSSTASGVKIDSNALSSGTRPAHVAVLKSKGIAVLPSITDGTSAGYMSSVLKNPTKRNALVDQVVNLVVVNGYDGVDLDFEKFAFNDGQSSWTTTRPAWVTFVADLGARLHANGKLLAVSVPPMGVSGSNYWVYDWAGIGPHVDRLRIMAYDYSWCSPGPIGGPLTWVDKVAAFAVSVMPASKVQLGTPTYGRDWVKRSTCTLTGQKVYASRDLGTAVNNTPAGSWKRDPASQERYLNYTEMVNGVVVSRSAWLPDSVTVAARARIASKYGLAGIASWTLGGEQNAMWAPLRAIALTLPFSTSTGVRARKVSVKVKSVNRRIVKVSGRVLPKRAKVKVRLQVKRGNKWRSMRTVKTKASGMYVVKVKRASVKRSFRVRVLSSGGFAAKSSRVFTVSRS